MFGNSVEVMVVVVILVIVVDVMTRMSVSLVTHTHTQPPLLGSVSVIIMRIISFSQDAPPQEGNLSLE
jgi:hypothetical protein